MLESQVSLKDFCNTLEFRCPYRAGKVRESCYYNYYEDIVTCTMSCI